MLAKRKRRLIFILCMLLGCSIVVGLAMYVMRNNIHLYYTPAQLKSLHIKSHQTIRLGGMVVKGTVNRVDKTLKVNFTLTDYQRTIKVYYDGILPSLFREGQGIIAQGQINDAGDFVATQVLAKHDAEYHPPGIPKKANEVTQ